jgi:hypothetical protein
MQLTFSTLQPTTLPEGQHGQAGNSTKISSSSQNGSKVADDSLFDHVFHYFYSPGVIDKGGSHLHQPQIHDR